MHYVTLCRCVCVTMPPHPHPSRKWNKAQWEASSMRRLLCELHLHSWKDNQPTGVFNLEYVRWTINHFVQPLHTAHRQGWGRISVTDKPAHIFCLGIDVLLLLQRERPPLLIPFIWGALSLRLTVTQCGFFFFFVSQLYGSSWDDGIVSAGCYVWGLFSQVLRLESDLQLSAPVYRASEGDRGGSKRYPCRREQKARL